MATDLDSFLETLTGAQTQDVATKALDLLPQDEALQVVTEWAKGAGLLGELAARAGDTDEGPEIPVDPYQDEE